MGIGKESALGGDNSNDEYSHNDGGSSTHSLTVWLAISITLIVVLIFAASFLTRFLLKRERARRRRERPAQDEEQVPQLTPEEKAARRLKRMERLDKQHPAVVYQEWRDEHVEEKETSEDECSVCLKPIAADEYIRQLDCNHCFHQSCVDEWVGGGHDACPLCRGIILTDLLKWPVVQPAHVRAHRCGAADDDTDEDETSHASQSNAGL